METFEEYPSNFNIFKKDIKGTVMQIEKLKKH